MQFWVWNYKVIKGELNHVIYSVIRNIAHKKYQILYKVSHYIIYHILSFSTNMDSYAVPLLSYFHDSRLIRRFSMCTYLYHILLFFRTHNRILKDTNTSTQNNLVLLATNVQISTNTFPKFSSWIWMYNHFHYFVLLSNYTLLNLRIRLCKTEIFWENILPFHHVYCHTVFLKRSKGWKEKC